MKPANATPTGDAQSMLRHLEWTVLRRLDGMLQGDYRSVLRGSGIDLADLREYQHHDDVRHIDWNVTARLQQAHVRVFTEDREMAVWFVTDLSASVDFGSGQRIKSQLAFELIALLSRLFTRHGNRVGALLYGGQSDKLQSGPRHTPDQVIPPGNSRRHQLALLHGLQQHAAQRQASAASARGKPDKPQGTHLAEWLRSAGSLIQRRSTVLVLSDFISEADWEKPLGQLAQRHDVLAVRLYDPLEHDLPDLGLLTLRDAETGEQLLVDTQDRQFRQRFAQLAQAREQQVRDSFAKAGVDVLELSTDDDLLNALTRFIDLRKRKAGKRGIVPLSLDSRKAA